MSGLTQEDVLKKAMSYHMAFQTYAYGFLSDWALAEDVVQNAYIIVMKKWQDFQPGTSMFSWVRSIVRFKSLEMLKTRTKHFKTDEINMNYTADLALEKLFLEESADRQKKMLVKLHECLRLLGERPVQMIRAFYIERRSYEDLSQMFDMKVETVRKNLYRIRQRLRACVRQEEEIIQNMEDL